MVFADNRRSQVVEVKATISIPFPEKGLSGRSRMLCWNSSATSPAPPLLGWVTGGTKQHTKTHLLQPQPSHEFLICRKNVSGVNRIHPALMCLCHTTLKPKGETISCDMFKSVARGTIFLLGCDSLLCADTHFCLPVTGISLNQPLADIA